MEKQVTAETAAHRHPTYEVEPLILNRWSPRSYKETEVPEEVLFSVFEAARWAPSANNEQPWRFIIARTKADREAFHSFIFPGNLAWCQKAPVLAVILSKKTTAKGEQSRAHAFDAGAAWAFLALQAESKGLATHAMGGFDRDKAREMLRVPNEFELHAVVSIGYRDRAEALPEAYREREKPSDRCPLAESLFEGEFGRPTLQG
jgi:nitroreductase